jgi:hypothetical protein
VLTAGRIVALIAVVGGLTRRPPAIRSRLCATLPGREHRTAMIARSVCWPRGSQRSCLRSALPRPWHKSPDDLLQTRFQAGRTLPCILRQDAICMHG